MLDRGFIFGDGVYELIPVYSRVPFRMDEHLARLERSLTAVRIRNPYSRAEWRDIHPAAGRQAVLRRSGRVFPGDARRRQARPRVPEGCRADSVHHVQSARQSAAGTGGARRPRGDRGGRSLASLRHQVDFAHRQLPAAPGFGGRGRCRDNPVPRRQTDRGFGFERVCRQEWRDPVAAQVEPDPARHHLRCDRRDRRGPPGCRWNIAISPRTRYVARTKSGSPRLPRRCSPS